ncbi:unnamed protein product [Pedinophyceae sp. YPF-701]|nr:unnamed protein product [Pedinophyceae sp. YPF-701]
MRVVPLFACACGSVLVPLVVAGWGGMEEAAWSLRPVLSSLSSTPLLTVLCAALACALLFGVTRGGQKKDGLPPHPPGTTGVPLLGETLKLLKAYTSNVEHAWYGPKIAQFGAIFRSHVYFSPAVFCGGDIARRLLSAREGGDGLEMWMPGTMRQLVGPLHPLRLQKSLHTPVRKALTLAMTPERLAKFVPVAQAIVDRHLAQWAGAESVKIADGADALACDTALPLAIGPRAAQAAGGADMLADIKRVYQGFFAVVPFPLPGTALRTALAAKRRIEAFHRAHLAARMGEGGVDEDSDGWGGVAHAVLAHEDPRIGGNMDLAVDLMIGLQIGGQKVPAVSMALLAFQIARRPDVRRRLPQELDEVLGPPGPSQRSPTFDDINGRLTFLDACVRESMRVRPIATAQMRVATRPLEVGGYQLPKDSMFFYSISLTHHMDPAFGAAEGRCPMAAAGTHFAHMDFDEGFLPDRWLKESDRKDERAAGAARPQRWVPFGAGMHACVAQNAALLAIKVFAATLFSRYHVELLDKRVAWSDSPFCELEHRVPARIFPRKAR